MKRISFNEDDAAELYELALDNFQDGCFRCKNNKERLEKFLGEKHVKRIKRYVKKNPYCEK